MNLNFSLDQLGWEKKLKNAPKLLAILKRIEWYHHCIHELCLQHISHINSQYLQTLLTNLEPSQLKSLKLVYFKRYIEGLKTTYLPKSG